MYFVLFLFVAIMHYIETQNSIISPMSDAQLTMRVNSSLKSKVQDLVDSGTYRSISHFVEEAIREKLDRATDNEIISDPLVKYRAEKDKLISEVDRVLEILEPYKPLIELTKEFSKEDIALLIQVNKVYLNHKDKAKELVSEIKKNLDESHQ